MPAASGAVGSCPPPSPTYRQSRGSTPSRAVTSSKSLGSGLRNPAVQESTTASTSGDSGRSGQHSDSSTVQSGGDEQQRRGVGADAVEGEQARGAGGHEGDDELVEAVELAAGEFGAPAELPQRDAGGVADDVTRTGAQRGSLGDYRRHAVPGEPLPQVCSAC